MTSDTIFACYIVLVFHTHNNATHTMYMHVHAVYNNYYNAQKVMCMYSLYCRNNPGTSYCHTKSYPVLHQSLAIIQPPCTCTKKISATTSIGRSHISWDHNVQTQDQYTKLVLPYYVLRVRHVYYVFVTKKKTNTNNKIQIVHTYNVCIKQ